MLVSQVMGGSPEEPSSRSLGWQRSNRDHDKRGDVSSPFMSKAPKPKCSPRSRAADVPLVPEAAG